MAQIFSKLPNHITPETQISYANSIVKQTRKTRIRFRLSNSIGKIYFKIIALTLDDKILYTKEFTAEGIFEFDYELNIDFKVNAYFTKNGSSLIAGSFDLEQLPLYEDALVFDGVNDYGVSNNQPILEDFTLIADRIRMDINWFSGKGAKGAFMVEPSFSDKDGTVIYSYEQRNNVPNIEKSQIVYLTPTSYSGQTIIKGSASDASDTLFIGKQRFDGHPSRMALYKFLLFNRTLTQEELDYVKYVIMGADLPRPIARWSAKGKSNEDTDKDVLKDLTGNGHDIQLHGFDYSGDSGYGNPLYPDALVFDGVNDYGECNNMPIFTKENGYTVIAKRKWDENSVNAFLSKSDNDGLNSVNGAFAFECLWNYNNYSFGGRNDIGIIKNDISFMTSVNYNGLKMNVGIQEDNKSMTLGKIYNGGRTSWKGAFYELHIFDHDLTPTEIELYIKKYIDKNYKLPIVTPAGEIK